MTTPPPLVGSLDEGTSSVRFTIYTISGEVVAQHQQPLTFIYPEEGWVEQNPTEILKVSEACIDAAVRQLPQKGYRRNDLGAIGITNQRETTIVWDRTTGRPLYNAVVWMDARTAETVDDLVARTPSKSKTALQDRCGLPLSTYFSAVKFRWLLDNVPAVERAVKQGRCMFGTVDTWLIWNFTGGLSGGAHVTDVTNASRTMLMNIDSLSWDASLCGFFGVPLAILPKICSSAEVYGRMTRGIARDTPLSGCLGDQHAALVGQRCFRAGDAKNTYGTGCFLLCNTGTRPVASAHGLLTTVAYKLGPDAPAAYALEGAVAVAGAGIQWLRDNLEIIGGVSEVEKLASSVDSTHGVYFVPAFAGLLAPHWRPDARGTLVGLTQYSTRAHVVRAALEAVCFQSRDVLEAMTRDRDGAPLHEVRVDGGMTRNSLLLQIQADLLGVTVVRPRDVETTSWGAALAAGKGAGLWPLDENTGATPDSGATHFSPKITDEEVSRRCAEWDKAVSRSLSWAVTTTTCDRENDGTKAVGDTATAATALLPCPLYLVAGAVAAGAVALALMRRR